MNAVAVITGASRGIGRAIAVELAALGFDLLLNYRSDDAAMTSTVEACRMAGSARVERFKGDIGETATRQSLIDQTREEFGRLDLLVNNAGIAPKERLELLNTTEESFDQLIAINLKAPF